MPSIDVAMRRSLSGSALDLLAAAMRPVVQEVQKRDIITDTKGKIVDVKTAFSSWDNCMQADFCKWPVIAIIVIGGLFIFSIVWCCARCLCCGVSCCCECFYCLKCCGNCCGCCDAPHKKHKYLDEPYIPPHQGYRMEAPMTAPMAGAMAVKSNHHEAPQYAEFDMSKKGGEDSLPAMPSWEGSGNKKIEVEQEAVELEQLNKPATNTQQPGQNVPLMTGTSATPGPVSPVSPLPQDPYAHPGSRQGSNAYLAGGAAAAADPYARHGDGYGASDGYGQSTSNLSMDQGQPGGMNQGYGMAAAGMAGGAMAGAAMGPGRRSPREYGGNGRYGTPPPMGQGYPGPRASPGPGRQGSYDNYRRNGSGPPGAMPGFGSDSVQREPRIPDVMGGAYADQSPRRSPAPQAHQGYRGDYNRSPAPPGPYGPPQPQRQYSSDSTRPLARPPPQRQFSPAPASPTGLQNSGGFDFNSGYSRPSTSDNNNSFDQPRHASPQPQQQQHTGGAGGASAYPGFKAYQPPSATNNSRPHENWSGL